MANGPGLQAPPTNLNPIDQGLRNVGWMAGFNPQGQFVGWGGSTGNPVGGGNGIGPAPPQLTPIDRSTMGTKPVEKQATDKIDETTAAQIKAIDDAMAFLKGDPSAGTPGFMDKLRTTVAHMTGPDAPASLAVDETKAAGQAAVQDAKVQFGDLWNAWQGQLATFKSEGDKIVRDYRDTSAIQVQQNVMGLKQAAAQQAGDLRAKAEAMGIPHDQIEAQISNINRDAMYSAGALIGATSAKTNDTIASLRQNTQALIGSAFGQGLGAMVSAGSNVLSTQIQSAVNVLNARSGQQKATEAASSILAQGETLTTQQVTALETLRAQVASGDRDAFLNWQTSWEQINQMADALMLNAQ